MGELSTLELQSWLKKWLTWPIDFECCKLIEQSWCVSSFWSCSMPRVSQESIYRGLRKKNNLDSKQTNSQFMNRVTERINHVLLEYINQTYPEQDGRFLQLIMKLPELTAIRYKSRSLILISIWTCGVQSSIYPFAKLCISWNFQKCTFFKYPLLIKLFWNIKIQPKNRIVVVGKEANRFYRCADVDGRNAECTIQ